MMSDPTQIPLSKHQDHVVKHVLGCTLLGVYSQPGHLHILLDIPFLWSVDADGAMALVQDEEAVNEFHEPAEKIAELIAEIQTLHDAGPDAEGVRHFQPPPAIGAIQDVDLHRHSTDGDLRITVVGDEGEMTIALRASLNAVELI
jgi:hypothetical protein